MVAAVFLPRCVRFCWRKLARSRVAQNRFRCAGRNRGQGPQKLLNAGRPGGDFPFRNDPRHPHPRRERKYDRPGSVGPNVGRHRPRGARRPVAWGVHHRARGGKRRRPEEQRSVAAAIDEPRGDAQFDGQHRRAGVQSRHWRISRVRAHNRRGNCARDAHRCRRPLSPHPCSGWDGQPESFSHRRRGTNSGCDRHGRTSSAAGFQSHRKSGRRSARPDQTPGIRRGLVQGNGQRCLGD